MYVVNRVWPEAKIGTLLSLVLSLPTKSLSAAIYSYAELQQTDLLLLPLKLNGDTITIRLQHTFSYLGYCTTSRLLAIAVLRTDRLRQRQRLRHTQTPTDTLSHNKGRNIRRDIR